MSLAQQFDELVREQRNHGFSNWTDESHDGNYSEVLRGLIRRNGKTLIPLLTRSISVYGKGGLQACNTFDFRVASDEAMEIDRQEVRLRGTDDGKMLIEELAVVIQLMKESGYEDANNALNSQYSVSATYLQSLMGLNETDEAIRNTFWVKRKMQLSDDDLTKFIEYLVHTDPSYPRWSATTGIIKDYSRKNEAGYPLQIRLLENPEQFYDAYSSFEHSK